MGKLSNELDAWGIRYPAPAKLNLMLRITGRRSDGYHLLQTVFQMLELSDWLRFYPTEDESISLINPIPGVPEQEELTIRAARLLATYSGTKKGVKIELEKNLPMGGGLGGGSSDAATTLVVLNRLWGLGLSKDELIDLGLKLGADVPVFIFGHSAWGEGVGEQLQMLTLPENWVIIIKPKCHVNTKEVFCAKDLTRDSESIKISDFLAGDVRNDCTHVVCMYHPEVKEALECLSNYAAARLTGTGACVFALFSSKEEAELVVNELLGDWLVYLTKCVNVSPLYKALEI